MLLSNGVKPEEMKWTGLDEFLTAKGKGKVTPQEIQEHLAGNNLQVKEVMKGTVDNRSKIENLDKQIADVNQRFAQSQDKNERDSLWKQYQSLTEERRNIPSSETLGGGPKFGSYTLPGGEPGSYRELLITLPDKRTPTYGPRITELPAGYKVVQGQDVPATPEWGDLGQPRQSWHVEGPDGLPFGLGDSKEDSIRFALEDLNYKRRRAAEDAMAKDKTSFRSNHWPEDVNPVGHIRFNDRTGPNGERILHLEELQSDWHQKGRSTRYVDPKKPFSVAGVEGQFATRKEAEEAWRNMPNSWADKPPEHFIRDERTGDRPEGAVPDAPFKKTWPELLLKRMMKYAAENGYDGISWTPGEQQAERYDLSKQVDAIHYRSAGPRMFSVEAYRQGVGTVLSQTGTPEELEGVVGKDIVRKMVAKEGKEVGGPGDFRKLTGVDLKVGGEGMKGFYDKIVPDAANKLGKPWGAKVGETKIVTETTPKKTYVGPSYTYEQLKKIADDSKGTMIEGAAKWVADSVKQGSSLEEAMDAYGSPMLAEKLGGSIDVVSKKKTVPVPYLPITPQMRAGVKSIPFSLFSIPLAAGALTLAQVKAKAEELKPKSVQVRDPHGYVHTFPNQQAADNFKREAGIQ